MSSLSREGKFDALCKIVIYRSSFAIPSQVILQALPSPEAQSRGSVVDFR